MKTFGLPLMKMLHNLYHIMKHEMNIIVTSFLRQDISNVQEECYSLFSLIREMISLWKFRILSLAVFILMMQRKLPTTANCYNNIKVEIFCLISCQINCFKVIVYLIVNKIIWYDRFYGFLLHIPEQKLNRMKLIYSSHFSISFHVLVKVIF